MESITARIISPSSRQSIIPQNANNNDKGKIKFVLTLLLIFLLPTQFGKHFWPSFSFIQGLRIDYLSPTIYATDILIAFIAICSFNRKNSTRFFHHKKVSILLLPLFLCVITGIFLSRSPLLGFYALAKICEYLFFGIYLSRFLYQNKTAVLISLSLSILMESLLAASQYISHSSLGGFWYFLGERSFTQNTPGIANASINGELILRPYATFSHPNVLAGFLCITMTILLVSLLDSGYLTVQTKKKLLLKTTLTISLVAGTISLLLTLSRSAILVWCAVLMSFFLYKAWKNFSRKKHLRLSLLLPPLAILTGFFIYPQIYYRFFQTSLTDQSVIQRETLINAAITLIKAHPLFGVGLGNFLPSLSLLSSQTTKIDLLQPVHNIFLLLAAEGGLPAFFLIIVIGVSAYKKLIHALKTDSQPYALLAITLFTEILLLGLTDHYFLTLQQGQLLLAFVGGIIWLHQPKNDKIR